MATLRRVTTSRRPDHERWWRSAVVYQLYVRSFADADGDGRGDLQGIIDRLDHLEQLGVDAVWLNPCYPSPQLDHGYDVSDYFDIEPTYGDLATFDRLVAEANRRRIRVLMDVVPNHCSAQHAWFTSALQAAPGSAERARFYFRDGRGPDGAEPPNNWRSVFGGPAWTRITEPDGQLGQWYLHTFAPAQPDLNWGNGDVRQHFREMLTFWFDRGVDGFRVDAVTVAGKHPDLPDAPPAPDGVAETDAWSHNPYTVFVDSAHEVWREWRSVVDEYERSHPGRHLVTVSEAYTPRRPDLLLKFVEHDQFHQSFGFDLMLSPWNATLLRTAVTDIYDLLTGAGSSLTWTLNNHDVQRAVTRYGRADASSPESWTGSNLVYTGTAVDLDIGVRRAHAMIAFAAGLPGSLYLYQGEELGLPEVLDIPADRREDPIFFQTDGREIGRDGCRVPLPWTTDRSTAFGFSPRPAEPWLPQPDDWGRYAMSAQAADPASTLNFYRRLVAARRQLDQSTGLSWVEVDSSIPGADDVVAYRRGNVLVALNTGAHPVASEVLGAAARQLRSAVISSTGAARADTSARGAELLMTELPGDSCVWFGLVD
ncbi:MAG: hypothetical protein RLY45_1579 [Actinomycetota bacterium]